MIKVPLNCHSTTPPKASFALTASINPLPDGSLTLHYQLTGDIAQLRIPSPQPPAAIDGLWEHTCFEAFVAVPGEPRYHEFNFSPSGQWAAYAFGNARERCPWATPQAPRLAFQQSSNTVLLTACLPAVALPPNELKKPLQLGLTAVLESLDGHRSYWALHHPVPYPDFHDRAGFILTLD
jgi:hypothetical protein